MDIPDYFMQDKWDKNMRDKCNNCLAKYLVFQKGLLLYLLKKDIIYIK
jgi:hypothetical protein